MNNYANWEITQLLPEINPYKSEFFCEQQDWYLDIEQTDRFIHLGEYPDTEYEFIRNAWSWEDIRLYLLSQEIEFFIDTYYGYDKKQYYFVVEIGKYDTSDYEYYDSEVHDWLFDDYEEAREEAIKYCLTKIKNG